MSCFAGKIEIFTRGPVPARSSAEGHGIRPPDEGWVEPAYRFGLIQILAWEHVHTSIHWKEDELPWSCSVLLLLTSVTHIVFVAVDGCRHVRAHQDITIILIDLPMQPFSCSW